MPKQRQKTVRPDEKQAPAAAKATASAVHVATLPQPRATAWIVSSESLTYATAVASASFVLVAMNTKDSGNVRRPAANPGITQTAAPLFQSVMTCLKLHIKNTFKSVPAVWLLSEVAWVLGGGNMSSLSQLAPDGAKSRRETTKGKLPDAAVIWGAKYA